MRWIIQVDKYNYLNTLQLNYKLGVGRIAISQPWPVGTTTESSHSSRSELVIKFIIIFCFIFYEDTPIKPY